MKKIELILTLLFLTTTAWTSQIVNPAASGGGSGSGIVSPGTFTWTNPNGISASTLTVTSDNTTVPLGVANLGQLQNLAASNAIINGNMQFWQRGTSFSFTGTGTQYTADRWEEREVNATPGGSMALNTGTVKNAQRSFAFTITTNGGGAVTQAYVRQQIENYFDYAGSSVTLTAWVNSNTGTTIAIKDSVSTSSSAAHPADSAWHQLTVTRFLASSITTLEVQLGNQTTPAVSVQYYDGVMMVLGDTPVNYVPRSYPAELALCQRYYEKSYEVDTAPGTATSTALLTLAFPQDSATTCRSTAYGWKTQMRTSPTVTYYNGNGTAGTWTWLPISGGSTQQTVSSDNPSQTQLNMAASFTTHGNIAQGHFTADAEMP